jgi:glycosyltransferase involved in cell wall biosynthesis
LNIALAIVYAGMATMAVTNVIFLSRRPRQAKLPADPPLVSVIIPARNEAENLKRLIPSVLSQRYPKLEVIVYDDGSEDETWAIATGFGDRRLTVMRGAGPPPGWVGKVHALYQATRLAHGKVFLFLDADAEFRHADAVGQLVQRFLALPSPSLLSGLPRLRGGGQLLVSFITYVLLAFYPTPLARRIRHRLVGILNGQFWLIDRKLYLRYEPHQAHSNEVLEDVMIGRFFKEQGITTYMQNVQSELDVWMYRNHGAAWQGFRKNAYLVWGGTVVTWLFSVVALATVFLIGPVLVPWVLAALYVLKITTDRFAGVPFWVSLLTPVSFVLAAALQVDSALGHWFGKVQWKGRAVAGRSRRTTQGVAPTGPQSIGSS